MFVFFNSTDYWAKGPNKVWHELNGVESASVYCLLKMTTLDEYKFFFEQYASDAIGVSALAPTSAFSAREMGSEIARTTGPKRVLEVGSGTGSIAAELAKMLGTDDELWMVEYNADFTEFLSNRVATEASFAAVRPNAHVFTGSILDLPEEAMAEKFDYIVSSLPFNSFPGDFVQQVFDLYQLILKPSGSLSYIEYMGGRFLKSTFQPDAAVSESNLITERMMEQYEFRKTPILLNLPPAWIHHLRFGKPELADIERLELRPRDSFEVADQRFDWDALLFVIPLLAWAFTRKKLWPALLAIPIALFFRDPDRDVIADHKAILAGADGEVLEVATIQEPQLGAGEWTRIAVFLSITDVHVNRSPVAGRVSRVWHQPGGFEVADKPEAVHNESVYMEIETANGPIVVAHDVVAASYPT